MRMYDIRCFPGHLPGPLNMQSMAADWTFNN